MNEDLYYKLNLLFIPNPMLSLDLLELVNCDEAPEDDESYSDEDSQNNKNNSPSVTVCSLDGHSY